MNGSRRALETVFLVLSPTPVFTDSEKMTKMEPKMVRLMQPLRDSSMRTLESVSTKPLASKHKQIRELERKSRKIALVKAVPHRLRVLSA